MVVPWETGVTAPPPDPIVATPVLLLIQVPPPVASERARDEPIHTALPPVIVNGNGFTLTVVVT